MKLFAPACLLLLSAFACAPCAAQPAAKGAAKAPSAEAIERNNAEMRRLQAEFGASLKADKALAPLWVKSPLVPNEATPEQLARTDMINADDIDLMNELSRRTVRYQQQVHELLARQGVGGPVLEVWASGARATAMLRKMLTDKQIAWGDYNNRLRELTTAHRMALADTADALEMKDEKQKAQAVDATRRKLEKAYAMALGR